MLKTIYMYYFTLMDNLIEKLDENLINNYENIRSLGENSHPQESWISNSYSDLFNKLYFQRCLSQCHGPCACLELAMVVRRH